MLPFRTTNGATFSFIVDFKGKELGFANLFFLDHSRQSAPFHLSLRRNTSLAVTNRRSGEDWGPERAHDIVFAEDRNSVAIQFDEDRVTVSLNGHEIFTEDGIYPGLDDIRHVSWGGAILEEGIALGGEANAHRAGIGEVRLEPPLALWGWGYDASRSEQVLGIEIEGIEEQPQIIPDSAPGIAAPLGAQTDRIAFHAPLPGRIWQAAGSEEAVTVHVTCNGMRCGDPLQLTREDVLAQIEEIATRGKPEEQCYAALSAIEHVRFADLYSRLSEPAQSFIRTAAKLYRVLEFLFPEAGEGSAQTAGSTRPDPDPSALVADRIRQELAAALRNDPDRGFVSALRRLLKPYPLPAEALRSLLLEMAEPACQTGEMTELHALAVSLGHGLPSESPIPFENSLRLPFLLLSGNLDDLAQAFEALSKHQGARLSPAVIAWTIRMVLQRETNPWEDRHVDGLLRSFMTLTEALAQGYWWLPCTQMTRTAVALLASCDTLPDILRQRATSFLLRCFGLSQAFWTELRAIRGTRHLPPDLAAAEAAFAGIEAHIGGAADPAGLARALDLFDAFGTIDAPRMRRELLGPSGLPETATGELYSRIRSNRQNPHETALRQLAYPGAAADPALAETARAALQQRWNNVDKAPYYASQTESSRGILALFSRIEAGGPDEEIQAMLAELLPRIRKLSGQISNYIGLGLGLLTLEGLVRLGAEPHAARVLAHMSDLIDAMPLPMKDGLATAPCILTALSALKRTMARRPSPAAQAALSLFPQRNDEIGLMPDAPLERPGWAERAPLFDTIVTVFSCQPYLETRIPPMRAGWLADLEKLGIPYVIVVGGGDGRIAGDVVHLDAPDDYEGLPQKTLKTVEWVYENTDFSYMLKIDDDCFLNVEEYFLSQSYRKFHFYGRALSRTLGAMNRAWHHEKSRSDRARMELDKSPEPSSYADGGGGYTLDRQAMQALLLAARSREGQRLIHSSFMEDKMVGDLLNMRGITVQSEDYYTAIWRRTHGSARPVMRWDNYFLPSAASPCKMIHLDTETAQAWASEVLTSPSLLPRKLWPTFRHAGLGFNSNQLELLTDESDLLRLNQADLAVICTCRNERSRLPAFLGHYRGLGVRCFLFIDNLSDDGTREFLSEQPDCAVFSADTHYNAGRYGTLWQVTAMANLRVGRWSLIADIDELLVYPGWDSATPSLPAHVNGGTFGEADAVRIHMLDMYPRGPLSDAELTSGSPFELAGFTDREPLLETGPYRGPYSNDRTLTSAVRHRLLPGSRPLLYLAQKYALLRYRPWMRFSEGLHYAAELRLAEQELIFCHFKYDAAFAARVHDEVSRGQHFNGAEEYRLYQDALTTNGLCFYDPEISVPWRESAPAKRLFG